MGVSPSIEFACVQGTSLFALRHDAERNGLWRGAVRLRVLDGDAQLIEPGTKAVHVDAEASRIALGPANRKLSYKAINNSAANNSDGPTDSSPNRFATMPTVAGNKDWPSTAAAIWKPT